MKKLLLLVASLIVMWANSAGATVIVVNPPARVQEGVSGIYDWTYAAVLQPGQSMKPGDFFTIYDFPFANSLSQPSFGTTSADDNASFSVSVQNTGITPAKTGAPDNPGITNITVTLLDGDTRVLAPGNQDLNTVGGVLQLGTLIVRSQTKLVADSNFSSVLHNGIPTEAVANTGALDVAAVPEPGSITLLVAGLLACGVVISRRRTLG